MFDVFQPFKQPPSLSNWSNPSYFQVVLRWTAAFAPAIPPSTPWGKWPATRAAWSTASRSRARNRRRCWLLRWAALLLACDIMGVPKLRLKNGAERWWACPLWRIQIARGMYIQKSSRWSILELWNSSQTHVEAPKRVCSFPVICTTYS